MIRKVFLTILLIIFIPAIVFSTTINFDTQIVNWESQTFTVPNQQTYLDISINNTSTCNNIEINTHIYLITNSGEERVRFRQIQKGENANFYIDLHNLMGQQIKAKINFISNTVGSCAKLQINSIAMNQRTTHFPNTRVAEVNALASHFEDNDGRLGIADDLWLLYSDLELEEIEAMVLSAKKLNAKTFRITEHPYVDFSKILDGTCSSSKYTVYDCIDEKQLLYRDDAIESVTDRGIIVLFGRGLTGFSNTEQIDISNPAHKAIIDSFFYYQNLYQYDGTSCVSIGDQFDTPWGSRIDYPDWIFYNLSDSILDRYKNNAKIFSFFEEINDNSFTHACIPGTLEKDQEKEDYLISRIKELTRRITTKLKPDKKLIFSGHILTPWGVSVNPNDPLQEKFTMNYDEFMEAMDHVYDDWDYFGIHPYIWSENPAWNPEQGGSVQQFFDDFEEVIQGTQKYGNKKIFINEFGYVSQGDTKVLEILPNYVQRMKQMIQTDNRIVGAAYWQLMNRPWFRKEWTAGFDMTIFDFDLRPNQPFYSQFMYDYPFETCNGIDDDGDGGIDDGCDDDHDGFVDATMNCNGERFQSWQYNDAWKISRAWEDTGKWVYEQDLSVWVWYQKEINSNLGTGWRVGQIYPCEGHWGDYDDTTWNESLEICDLLDNDSDGLIDEGCDEDNDGYINKDSYAPLTSGTKYPPSKFQTTYYSNEYKDVATGWFQNQQLGWIYQFGNGWFTVKMNTASKYSFDLDDSDPNEYPKIQANSICSQFTERYSQTQLNTEISNWKSGNLTLLEILKRTKLWKYCN